MDLKRLDELVEHNECPPDYVVYQVKALRQKPLKHLEAIDAQIKRLEEERAEIQETVKLYDRILAPIRRIPSDILRIIFQHCLPTDRNPTMAATEAPMLVTRICSSWRSAAMASPRLWSRLYIPFRIGVEGKRLSSSDPMVPLEKLIKTLELRCCAVEEWLSRSGSQALSVSIWYGQITHDMGLFTAKEIDRPTKLLFETLLKFSSRWKNLELSVPESVYHILEHMLSGYSLPSLVELTAAVDPSWYRWRLPGGQIPSTVLLRAPNLKRIFIHSVTGPSQLQLTTDLTLHSPDITHLTLAVFPVNECITLLRRHTRLVYCDIASTPNLFPNTLPTSTSTIHLPQLLSLRIGVPNKPNNLGDVLYNIIIAPKLRHVGYYNSFSTVVNGVPDTVPCAIPVHFVEASTNLERLQLQRLCFSAPNLLDIFKAASQHALTHLSLYDAKAWRRNSLTRDLESNWDPFDLESLIVGNFPDADMQTLLPSLEVFELDNTNVSDDLVLRFVTSRMKLRSPIAVIKKVVIQFIRLKDEKGYDLSEEIRAKANEAGVEVETIFRYALSTLQVEKKNNFLSPSYQGMPGMAYPSHREALEWVE